MAAPSPTRRDLLALALAAAATPAGAQRVKVVTLLGDSISAGYGLPGRDALPIQLQQAVARLGVANRVRGAGVSGDTTAGGLARVDFSVQKDTDVCVVALGANDLMRGLDPAVVRRNLDAIVRRLKARRMGVVLVGLQAPVEIGGGYARDFNAVFPAVAAAHGIPLVPNLLAGVARNRALNQPDGIHPNAAGVRIVARNLAPTVAKALRARA
jgi:acyl-CoA thioesterase I